MTGSSVKVNVTAELAWEIEINRFGEPIGKQHQYAAAYGGVTVYRNEDLLDRSNVLWLQ